MVVNNVIKLSFTAFGAITGYNVTRAIFSIYQLDIQPDLKTAIYMAAIILASTIFYFIGIKTMNSLANFFDKLEKTIQAMTLYEIFMSSVGLVLGLIIANLIAIPINKLNIVGVPLSIAINILFGSLGVAIASLKKNEPFPDFKKRHSDHKKVVDTSVIIDGRIVDIWRAGFLEGELIVPSFVLKELQHIADSSDQLKRNRGRRGLDVLNILQKELNCPVKIENVELSEGAEVDMELLKLAKKLGAKVLTIDYNLNKVASVHGVDVLNINELSNAVKPIALPGEEMVVQVIKDGKENGQGIGYLEDGTMIVVDGGKRYIGERINVLVTSVLQTAAGRMIFAKPKYTVERIV
ncbi:MAG TPA: TRAM domain-containing protein [Clostridiaceae bacterium]|nr:TRAM domain-containing protein [Clostridiaceae bacterium]